MSSRDRFWQRWLVVVTIVLALFGLSLVVAPALGRAVFGLLIHGSTSGIEDDLGAASIPYISLVHGVLGAVMLGWALALLFVFAGPFARGSWEAWLTATVSLAAWFVVDTAFSLVTGYWQNALLNLGFGVLYGIPLAATFSSYRGRKT